jgi:hypothetical protein
MTITIGDHPDWRGSSHGFAGRTLENSIPAVGNGTEQLFQFTPDENDGVIMVVLTLPANTYAFLDNVDIANSPVEHYNCATLNLLERFTMVFPPRGGKLSVTLGNNSGGTQNMPIRVVTYVGVDVDDMRIRQWRTMGSNPALAAGATLGPLSVHHANQFDTTNIIASCGAQPYTVTTASIYCDGTGPPQTVRAINRADTALANVTMNIAVALAADGAEISLKNTGAAPANAQLLARSYNTR